MSITSKNDMEASQHCGYEVGYKKPPRSGQFKPGDSGNKKGRPKGSRNFNTQLEKALNTKIKLKQDGVNRSATIIEATLVRLSQKAISGDMRAIATVLDYAKYLDSHAEKVNPINVIIGYPESEL